MGKTTVINNELDDALKKRYEVEGRAMINLISKKKRVAEARGTKEKKKQDALLKQRYDDDWRNWAKYFV